MKILIVDDKKENLNLLETLLKGKGYEVISASNGAEALEKLKAERADMVISNILMTVMDGFAMSSENKGDRHLKKIPFIFYTPTHIDLKKEDLALSVGADRFIVKTVAPAACIKTKQGLMRNLDKCKAWSKKPVLKEKKEAFKLHSEPILKSLEKNMLKLERGVIDQKSTQMDLRNAKAGLEQRLKELTAELAIANEQLSFERKQRVHAEQELQKVKLRSEKALKEAQDKIQRQVEARTAELRITNEQLIQKIEELQLAKDKLKQSEEMFRIVADFTYAWEYWRGIDGKFIYMSPSCERITGYKAREFIENPSLMIEIVHPEDRPALKTHMIKNNEFDGIFHLDFRIIRRDNEIRWINHYCQLVYNQDGKWLGCRGSNTDVTESKKAQDATLLQNEQLIQADKMAALGTLVGGVAHEINNPNTFIMSGAPQIKKMWSGLLPILDEYYEENGDFPVGNWQYTEVRERLSSLLDGITDGAKRIKRIVDDLNRFSRQEGSSTMAPVKINDVVNSALSFLSNLVKKSTRHLSCKFGKDLPELEGNAQRIEHAIINLIMNACQALSDKNKGILISTFHDPQAERIGVLIQDEGVGIKKEDLPRIFDPFFTTKRETGGTGLGLSITSRIIRDHGGAISFSSSLGKGTIVMLTLPTSKSSVDRGEVI